MLSDKSSGGLPVHIGFIMDGNGRWAVKRGLPRKLGHREGAQAFRKIARYCKKIGIKYVTFYAFSTENWKRPKEEVDELMRLFREYLDEVEDYARENTRLFFLGDKSAFDGDMARKMADMEEKSAGFDGMTLMLAMNYGGRDDIVHSVRKIAEMAANKEIRISDIDESLVSSLLYTGGIPDVDLLIRPSGEKRISNFLIWQSAYAEYYFTDTLWPDFSPKELDKALEDFASRKRRFGGV
ncbi:MAG: di-trans,poly-cis-decaprenylcistransferase [Oscillospiraceae bacterium]|nr:di-trans,poly-cis-decaprenylcistransferase [Oscillospiraceae bacterium]